MKSIDRRVKIEKKNINRERVIVGGAIVTALMFSLTFGLNVNASSVSSSNTSREGYVTERPYDVYSSAYLDSLNQMDYSKFDSSFISLYRDGNYFINGVSYSTDEVYLTKLEDGAYHLIKAGENSLDILTGEKFEGKKIALLCFRETSIFYEMYVNGLSTDGTMIVDNSFNDYVQNWDGSKHMQVPELKADIEASKEVRTR